MLSRFGKFVEPVRSKVYSKMNKYNRKLTARRRAQDEKLYANRADHMLNDRPLFISPKAFAKPRISEKAKEKGKQRMIAKLRAGFEAREKHIQLQKQLLAQMQRGRERKVADAKPKGQPTQQAQPQKGQQQQTQKQQQGQPKQQSAQIL